MPDTKLPGLSKSRYVAGLQCHKLLYTRTHDPDAIPEPDAFTQYLFDQGTAAGELATKFFSGGTVIPAFPIDESIQKTQAALENKAEHIFEAAFNFENIHVKVDVLRNLGGKFDIIEVKSGTSVKDVHLDDLAIQKYVLEGNGMEINSTILMHMNKEYRHPHGELFVLSDQTEKVNKRMPLVPENLEKMRDMLLQEKHPESRIGPQCKKPYECGLMKQCWNHIPDMSIFTIPGFRGKWDYYNQGIILLEDVPQDFMGTPSQMPFIYSFRSGKPHIDEKGLQDMLDELQEPIYFMDFETLQLAAPKYDGTKPWQQHTIQWSVHILKDGELEPEHHEFIHTEDSDPREPFIQSLLDVLGNSGSIVVYSASFEGGRLKEIAEAFPQYQEQIENILSRLWDQLVVFRKFYCDSKFKGSNSIKNVLPVLVPKLSYKNLEVQEGGTAMVEYARMIGLPDGEEKESIKNSLLEYCKLDTRAMVEIHRVLLTNMDKN